MPTSFGAAAVAAHAGRRAADCRPGLPPICNAWCMHVVVMVTLPGCRKRCLLAAAAHAVPSCRRPALLMQLFSRADPLPPQIGQLCSAVTP